MFEHSSLRCRLKDTTEIIVIITATTIMKQKILLLVVVFFLFLFVTARSLFFSSSGELAASVASPVVSVNRLEQVSSTAAPSVSSAKDDGKKNDVQKNKQPLVTNHISHDDADLFSDASLSHWSTFSLVHNPETSRALYFLWRAAKNFFFFFPPKAMNGEEITKKELYFSSISAENSSSSSSSSTSSRWRTTADEASTTTSHSSYCSNPRPGTSRFAQKYNMRATLCWGEVRASDGDTTSALCAGTIRLAPLNRSRPTYCDTTRDIKLSHNRRWARALRERIGPLHLRVVLEGPEVVQGSVHFDSSRCEYWSHFFVRSPGEYGIGSSKAQHDDFHAVDETFHRTRHSLNSNYLFHRSLPMLRCNLPVPSVDSTSAAMAQAAARRQQRQQHYYRWVQRPFGVPAFNLRHLRGNTLQLVSFFGATENLGVDPRAVPPFGAWNLAAGLSKNNPFRNFALSPWMPSKEDFRLDRGAGGAGEAAAASAAADQFKNDRELFNRFFNFPVEEWLNLSSFISPSRSCAGASPQNPLKLFVIGDSQARSVLYALKNYIETASQRSSTSTKKSSSGGGGGADDATDESFALRDKDGKKIKRAQHTLLGGRYELSYAWDSYLQALVARRGGHQQKHDDSFFSDEERAEEVQEAEDLKKQQYERGESATRVAGEAAELLETADVIVAGFGVHAASWGQWTFATYNRRSKLIARSLCQLAKGDDAEVTMQHGRRRKRTIIWFGAPALPKAKLVDNFRATNARLALFNSIAIKHLQEQCGARGVELSFALSNGLQRDAAVLHVVDFYGMSSAIMKISKDGAHYDGTVVVSAFAHQVFRILCG